MTVTVTNPPAGAFTFTVPATAAITMTCDTVTGALIPVTITDTRNTYPGWAVLGQVSDFTNPASQPPGDISGNQLGWAPTGTSLADGAVPGAAVGPAAPGLGTLAATWRR